MCVYLTRSLSFSLYATKTTTLAPHRTRAATNPERVSSICQFVSVSVVVGRWMRFQFFGLKSIREWNFFIVCDQKKVLTTLFRNRGISASIVVGGTCGPAHLAGTCPRHARRRAGSLGFAGAGKTIDFSAERWPLGLLLFGSFSGAGGFLLLLLGAVA